MRIALSLTVSLFCLGLAGCGQKGPLYLPTDPPPQSTPAQKQAPAQPGPSTTAPQP